MARRRGCGFLACLNEEARFHHAPRRRGGYVAARGAGAADGDAGDRLPQHLAIVLGMAQGAEPSPIWQSLTKIFWTIVVVGAVICGAIYFHRLRKQETAIIQAQQELRLELERLENHLGLQGIAWSTPQLLRMTIMRLASKSIEIRLSNNS